MKKNYFLLFFLFGILLLKAQIVNIPDANFKALLLSANTYENVAQDLSGNWIRIDSNWDGQIQVEEAQQVGYINCSGKNIATVEGINSFSNLKSLDCYTNQLTQLNLQLPNLNDLNCSNNLLAALNLNNVANLKILYCGNNSLTNLNFNNVPNLEKLGFDSNQITAVNLNNLSKLQSLSCNNVPLVQLTLQGLISLKEISCRETGLKALDFGGLSLIENIDCGANSLLINLNVQGLLNLKKLVCQETKLTSLNLNNLISLQSVDCSNSNLSSLTLANSSNLQSVACSYNNLTTLNFQGLTKLTGIICNYNQLTALNIEGLTGLQSISCSNNQLTTLDLKANKQLTAIICSNNLLTSLDLTGLTDLSGILCSDNKFTTLDFRGLPKLATIVMRSNYYLTSLYLKNGYNNSNHIDMINTNALRYICCDESEIDYVKTFVNQTLCSVNSYCSFTPGGDYNTIEGFSRYKPDNTDCTTNNAGVFIRYNINNGTENSLLFGNYEGKYKTYTNTGTYTLTPVFENPDYFIASPPSRQFVFSNSNSNTQNQDFCISANGTKNDLEVKIIPVNTVRPGFNTTFRLIYKNKGNTVQNGDVSFTFDHLKSELVSADISPNSSTAGNLSWTFNQLKPFESKTIIITLKTFTPPTVNVSEKLTYTAKLNPVSGDLTEYDNSFSLVQTVVGSFDPNDKVCLDGDVITPNLIGKYVTYKIRFENTGTANAEQVVVKDMINTAMFDVNSIIPIVASHSYKTRITGNVVEFIFENIDLPFDDANNDGYIVFKIKTLPNLIIGSQIKNKAEIYFDYNLPITTNEFVSSFQTLGTGDLELPKEDLKIYPNPVKDFINIESREKIVSIEIFDLNGRILSKSSPTSNKVDVKTLKSAIYIIKANTKSGYYLRKIIKE